MRSKEDEKYICIMTKKELDNSPISPILNNSEISSYYTNGQTYVHVREDRFIKLKEFIKQNSSK